MSCPKTMSGCISTATDREAVPQKTAACWGHALGGDKAPSEPEGGCCYYCGPKLDLCSKGALQASNWAAFSPQDMQVFSPVFCEGATEFPGAKRADDWFPDVGTSAGPLGSKAGQHVQPGPSSSSGGSSSIEEFISEADGINYLVTMRNRDSNKSSERSQTCSLCSMAKDATSGDSLTNESQGSQCFPSHATIELANGSVLRMDELSVGDFVKVGSGVFSQVFMFTHKLFDVTRTFVHVITASGHSIQLTPGHFIYVNNSLLPARSVRVGDLVQLGNGASMAVSSVTLVQSKGLFNPQTLHGEIVVDGVRASTFTTAVEPSAAHMLLTPLRMFFAIGFVQDPSFGLLEGGAGGVGHLLQSGGNMV